ncbi:MAG TPA: hypothetical protein VE783_11685 [Candidatus Limnocylindrales bacterium]|nr:hypothetical protein [Candidatus Limnocylindrales bacterium]
MSSGILSLVLCLFGCTLTAQEAPKKGNEDQGTPSETLNKVTGGPVAQSIATLPAGPVHIVPFGRGSQKLKNTFAAAGAHLTYWGGPVISQVHVVAVFWGSGVNSAITGANGIDQFFTDITQSQYYDLLTEYSTTGITGSGVPATSSNQAISRGVFDGKFTITPALCATTATCSLTDVQIQQELLRQLNNGGLPQPVTDTQGNVNTFYMIYFPPGVSINVGGTNSCVTNGFCAYHSNTATRLIPYGVQPDFAPPSGCSTGCGAGTLFDQVTAVTSHELSEAITDPQVGSATTTAPPLAWYDPDPAANPLAEIGDICNGQDTQVSVGRNTYMVQQEFSNLQNDCVAAPPIFKLNAPAGVVPSTAFNVTLTVESSNTLQNLTNYTGTVHFTSSDANAILPADYTFTSADAGVHTFSVTLATLGQQTLTVTDTRSAGFTATATINVSTAPDLTISKSHTGNFPAGQTGSYNIVVSNIGLGPTTAAVSVSDSLPAGLTAKTISGTGWTCTLSPLVCTRSDVLAVGNSYPPISLVVDVAFNTATFVTNQATVSGGGETNTANDIALDLTTVNQPIAPDLVIFKNHAGNFSQGQTGAVYNLSVSNQGNAATTGTITVTDTLPQGLTATSLSGTGWTCALATLTCTRSDAFAANALIPAITLIVDVATNAPATVVNSASVSGGGELNTTNDTAQDSTTIVPLVPDLTVTMGNSPLSFLQGQTGSFTITVSNAGAAPTSATVTATVALTAGLSPASLSGVGWTCDLPTVTCSRNDALAGFGSYPAISLSVNVAANAPASATATATVAGGGETNTANDAVSNVVSIFTPVIDLTPQITLITGNVIQGQTNATYRVVIANFGNSGSSGLLTVTHSLPAGLSAVDISGQGWTCTLATTTCTRSDSLGGSQGFSPINVTFNVANNATISLVSVSATISGGGDTTPNNNTASAPFNIDPMIQMVPNPVQDTVTAGQAATFGFAVTPAASAGTVTFSCSGLPKGTACGFNPASVTQAGNVTLTVTTTSRAGAFSFRFPQGTMPSMPVVVFAVMALTLLIASQRSRGLRPATAFCALLVIVAITGCGGGGGTNNFVPTPTPAPTPNPNGTPAGTYTVVVTATGSSAGTNSQGFILIVK